MTTPEQEENELRKPAEEKPRVKRPYKKPGFRYETVFVTTALTCGKTNGTQTGCQLNRKVS
jgi:hypothetical protein